MPHNERWPGDNDTARSGHTSNRVEIFSQPPFAVKAGEASQMMSLGMDPKGAGNERILSACSFTDEVAIEG